MEQLFGGSVISDSRFSMLSNVKVVLQAVGTDGHALKWLGEDMRDNSDVVKIAVIQDGRAIKWASEELRGFKVGCGFVVLRDEDFDFSPAVFGGCVYVMAADVVEAGFPRDIPCRHVQH